MKILVARTSDGTDGGAEQAARDHALSFKQLGHEVAYISNLSTHRTTCKQVGVRVYRSVLPPVKLGTLAKFVILPIVWIYYGFLALVIRPDIINTHSREEHIGFTLTKWLHKRPVVWKDPGDLIHLIRVRRSNPLGWLNQKILLKALGRANTIYTLNAEDRKTIIERVNKLKVGIDNQKLRVIESNILFSDLDLDAPPPEETSKLVISYVGRLDEIKGVHYLIEAYKNISPNNELALWIVGDGKDRGLLNAMSLDNPGITFWGFRSDISPFMARTDVFVQPAMVEGWGRNVKEAMYFGKPVVGSNTGGIAVQIDDEKTGLLFEPGNVKQLIAQLKRLINDKSLRDKLGKAARQKALADGDYVTLVKTKILPLFEEVLAKE